MKGRNVFYPMGWDDNGLPTERRVQNYFHVRCEPGVPHDPGLPMVMADDETRKGPPRKVSRRNFIDLCLALTAEDEKVFKALWQRLGLSVDWSLEYSTISDSSRRLAQLSFLDLHAKGHVYNVFAPTMWDVDFRTAVAQAEVEDRPQKGAFHELRFGVLGGSGFVIATTRPELLPACVAVAAHPDDERYRGLFGKSAITPVFQTPVPIFASPLVDKDKGTGILMVCTFGDQTDVQWWREQKLPLRQIVGRNGQLVPVEFGTEAFPSRDPARANAAYALLAGKSLKEAQRALVELLRDPAHAAAGDGEAPLRGEPKLIEHAVKFYEKGDRPLEFVTTRQWFVRILEHKEELLQAGDRISWHPDFMRQRYRNWTENLQLDWCVSRQRYFGVPFPVWYAVKDNGETDFERPLLALPETLPVDPTSDAPPGFAEAQRDLPGGFRAETDVFDTWFTSSLTPQIASGWTDKPARHAKLFPMDLRPQSHEIIRTWAFYTIVKAHLHEGEIPWRNVAISGWVLDPDRKKMSKSKGNVITPMHLLDQYGADAVRYWSLAARLGTDTAFDEKVLKVGRRLAVKLFNASKFALGQEGPDGPVTRELDLSFLSRLRETVTRASLAMEAYEYQAALEASERFFWSGFTDTYMEMVKARCRAEDDPEGRGFGPGHPAARAAHLPAPLRPLPALRDGGGLVVELRERGVPERPPCPLARRGRLRGASRGLRRRGGLRGGGGLPRRRESREERPRGDGGTARQAPRGRRHPPHPGPLRPRARRRAGGGPGLGPHLRGQPRPRRDGVRGGGGGAHGAARRPRVEGLRPWTSASWCGARSTRTASTAISPPSPPCPRTPMRAAFFSPRKPWSFRASTSAASSSTRSIPGSRLTPNVAEGGAARPGDVIGRVEGPARGLLQAERVALNFLQRLSGVATLTRRFVDAVAGTGARIRDTRKTTPLLRALQKRAVVAGGGVSHRAGLDDAILVKDNHVRLAGSVAEATRRAVAAALGRPVEVEVERLDQIEEALQAGATMLLLDNFTPADVRTAVGLIAGRVPVEVSGGVTLSTVRAYAEAGADLIAVGALTHSAPGADISLEIEPAPRS